jgi:hypothetical protein
LRSEPTLAGGLAFRFAPGQRLKRPVRPQIYRQGWNMDESDRTSITKRITAEALELLPRAYDDLLRPAAQEMGKGLETIAKSLSIVLSPLAGMVWGFDRLKAFLAEDIAKRLEQRRTKKIITPAPSIAVPTLVALTYLGSEAELCDLFANLLVSAVDAESAAAVHPAFVEIIKQLSADEARILRELKKEKYFPLICEGSYRDGEYHDAHSMLSEIYADFGRVCAAADLAEGIETGHYMDNLLRLRLLEVKEVSDVELEERPRRPWSEESAQFGISRSRYEALYVTKFGMRFLDICVRLGNVEQEREPDA